MLRQPCLCSKRHFSSLFESFELGIEAEESPRGRLERGSVGDELQPELTKSERSEHLYVSVLITPPEVANTGPGVNRGSGGGARGCGFEERVGVHARSGGVHFL